MSDNWIRKYEKAAEERQRYEDDFMKRKEQKIRALQRVITDRLKAVFDRLSRVDSCAWEFNNWNSGWTYRPEERLYFQIIRSKGTVPDAEPRSVMRLVTTVDDDFVELYFSLVGSLKRFSYRFPLSHQITDEDIRQWFECLMGESKKPWKSGRKFRIRRRQFD